MFRDGFDLLKICTKIKYCLFVYFVFTRHWAFTVISAFDLIIKSKSNTLILEAKRTPRCKKITTYLVQNPIIGVESKVIGLTVGSIIF